MFLSTINCAGKYLEVEPLGITHLKFDKSGNHYSWRKVKTVVHNIVIGKLWIDQVGEMEVVNHTTGDKCYMKFEPYSYFGGVPKKVTGTINSTDGKLEWVLNGTWDEKMEGSKVIGEAVVKVREARGGDCELLSDLVFRENPNWRLETAKCCGRKPQCQQSQRSITTSPGSPVNSTRWRTGSVPRTPGSGRTRG